VHVQDYRGWTALMMAASINNPLIIQLLLAGGADVSVRDHNSKRAFDKAKDHKVRFMLSAAAVETRLKSTY